MIDAIVVAHIEYKSSEEEKNNLTIYRIFSHWLEYL